MGNDVEDVRARVQARAEVAKKARDTGALRQLEPFAKEISIRFEKAAKLDDKAADHRLAAAIQLGEAEGLCKRHKINFKKWAAANFSQRWDEVQRLTAVGTSDDPKKAIEDLRAGQRAKAQKKRVQDRADKVALPLGFAPTPDHVFQLFNDMSPAAKMAFLTRAAESVGAAVDYGFTKVPDQRPDPKPKPEPDQVRELGDVPEFLKKKRKES